jgi:hypothetical protein
MAVCGFLFAGCSQPAEPETEAAAEESIEEQEAMMEAEMQEGAGGEEAPATP